MSVLFRAVMGVLIWSFATGAVAATPAQLDQARSKGVAWLFSNQTGEGCWKSSSGLQIQPTSAALEAFLNAGVKKGFSYATAAAWLGNAEAPSTESLSRQSMALFRSGARVTSLMTRLLDMRHPRTKSWGAYDRYPGSFPDTSLAMAAITLTGTTYADISSSLGFISGNQNADGGWPYANGAPTTPQSSIIPTAYNLITLSRYKTLGWSVDSYITKGVNWLIARKKTDGGFAEETTATTGSVYETALAYLALAEAKKAGNAAATGAQTVMDGAQNFLVAQQQTNGSWGQEPFQTALALQTLPTVTMTDTDQDGIPDSVETLLGTNPAVADGRALVKGNGQSIPGVTTPLLLGTAVRNMPFSATLPSAGGTAPYTWRIASGSLPTGLSLNAATGVISGSPTTVGTFTFIYVVTDSASTSSTSLGQIRVTVSGAMAASVPITPTTDAMPEEELIAASIALSVSPAVIAADYTGTVQLAVNHLPESGSQLLLEQLVDTNRNGLADEEDYVIRAFTITDGTASANSNVQGDEDATTDASVVTSLNYRLLNDLYHAPGQYLFRVTQGSESEVAAFTIDPVSHLQTVSGVVTDGDNPIPGAMVRLVDRWRRTVAFVISDDAGQYTFNVKESDVYALIPSAYGFAAAHSSVHPITLAPSQDIIGNDLSLIPGNYHLGGRVKDAADGAGIPGVWVLADSAEYSGVAITDSNGDYDLLLPSGRYTVTVTADVAEPNAFAKGYTGFDRQLDSVDLTGHVAGMDLALPKTSTMVSGRVLDQFGLGVSGLPVAGKGADVREPVGYGITDADGAYTLGVLPSTNWDILLHEPTAQTVGYVGTIISDFSTSTGQASASDLSSHTITAWVQGTVKDSSGKPLAGVAVKIRNDDSSVVVNGMTAPDGTYRLGVYAGAWFFDVLTEEQGYVAMSEQSLALNDGQILSKDYAAAKKLKIKKEKM